MSAVVQDNTRCYRGTNVIYKGLGVPEESDIWDNAKQYTVFRKLQVIKNDLEFRVSVGSIEFQQIIII